MRKVKLTPERRALYEVARAKAQQIVDICDGILVSEKTEAQACKDAGKDLSKFRHFCQNAVKNEPTLRHTIKEDDWSIGWREALLKYITGEDIAAPDNFDEIYKEVCAKALSPQEIKVLDLRNDGFTFEEIGKNLQVSRERIRQTESKALRILRNPKYRLRLAYGDEYYRVLLERNDAQDRYDRAYLDAGIAAELKSKKQIEENMAEMRAKTESLKADTKAILDETKDMSPMEIAMTKVRFSDLGLSVRSFNCINRHFGHCDPTAYEVSLLTYEDLMSVRNLGRRSLEEITKCFHEKFGFSFAMSKEKK